MDINVRQDLVKAISQLVRLLSAKEKTLFQSILETGLETETDALPVSIFSSDLSGLEAIVYYLKEIKKKKVKEISKTLNRKKSTIYTTSKKAKKKIKCKLNTSDYSVSIPLKIFANRKFSILESLVAYLKNNLNFTLAQISALLNKNYSTVKTVYYRYNKKCH